MNQVDKIEVVESERGGVDITAPREFLAHIEQVEGGLETFLRNSIVFKVAADKYGEAHAIEVALQSRYASWKGSKRTEAELEAMADE